MNGSNVPPAVHPGEYIQPANNYYPNQGQYYHQSYYIPPQPALTATTGSQITYQLQDPPTEAMGEIKYTIDETDRRRGGKKSKKNRVDGVDVLENEIERQGFYQDPSHCERHLSELIIKCLITKIKDDKKPLKECLYGI